MRTRFYGKAPMPAFLFAIAFAVAVGLSVPAVGQDQAEDVGESLDDELLRELQEDLLDLDLDNDIGDGDTSDDDISDGDASDDTKEGSDAKAKSDLDRQLERQLGEDVGLGPDDDPLSRIASLMRRAEQRTAQADASAETRKLQEKIVDDLDELIKQVRRQQKKQSSASGRQQQSQRSKATQPSKPGQSGQPASSGANRDSTDRVGRADAQQVDMDDVTNRLKDLWGHLPVRLREEMINSLGEQFLPKYEVQIEKYFKRLAEQPDGRRPPAPQPVGREN